jgi:hypothetical protein
MFPFIIVDFFNDKQNEWVGVIRLQLAPRQIVRSNVIIYIGTISIFLLRVLLVEKDPFEPEVQMRKAL